MGGGEETMSTDNPFDKSGCERKPSGWKKDGVKEVCYRIGRIWDNINAAKLLSIDRKSWSKINREGRRWDPEHRWKAGPCSRIKGTSSIKTGEKEWICVDTLSPLCADTLYRVGGRKLRKVLSRGFYFLCEVGSEVRAQRSPSRGQTQLTMGI